MLNLLTAAVAHLFPSTSPEVRRLVALHDAHQTSGAEPGVGAPVEPNAPVSASAAGAGEHSAPEPQPILSWPDHRAHPSHSHEFTDEQLHRLLLHWSGGNL